MNKLPDKLSALILVALTDLTKAERSPNYVIEMKDWHRPNSHCSVCFAGAVMAFSLKCDPKKFVNPEDLGKRTARKLFALDDARLGYFEAATQELGLSSRQQLKARVVEIETGGIPYYGDPDFKPTLRKAARALAKIGL